MPSPPVGEVKAAYLGLLSAKSAESQSIDAWFCQSLEIADPVSKDTFVFEVNKNIQPFPDLQVRSALKAIPSRKIEDVSKQYLQQIKGKSLLIDAP
ncbi:hypothetical protein Ciccas_011793 [Cichlidogyrus casuarinus]|uniref:Uncharacterized protein n=1 Tax=Cichlidogyrus casuarinus TaxID=1844966 RepID=A0ABD2PT90_9PLAT